MKKKLYALSLVGLLLGASMIVTLRAALYAPTAVHYHANFALFINGKHDKFDTFTYYEEVQACRGENSNEPKEKVHMHQPNNHVAHVHAAAVTWGEFFANLGYGLSDKAVTTDDGVYVTGLDGKKLTFLLNGESVQTVSNRVINDKDMLLISYGNDDVTALKAQNDSVPKDAEEVNKGTDPASCGGAEKVTLGARLKHAINFTD